MSNPGNTQIHFHQQSLSQVQLWNLKWPKDTSGSVSLMHGLMLNDPLPTTKVGNLRINHILLEIEFGKPLQLDKNSTEEVNYKVGNKNYLFGIQLRNDNAKKFKQAQAIKKGAVTKHMLTSLLKTMSDMNVDGKTSGDGDEDISDLEDNADGKLQLGETPSLFRSNSNAYDSNSWPNRNSGLAQPSFNQSYRPTPEQNHVTTLVRDRVRPTHGGPNFSQAEGGQPLDDAASLDSRNVVPKGSDAEDEQVRIEIQIGRQNIFCIRLQSRLLKLLQSTLEKYSQVHPSFQSLLSPSHQLTRESWT